jgi:hypoxanthine phosphoribosyltransferase
MNEEKYLLTLEEFLKARDSLVLQIKESGIKYEALIGNLRGGYYLCDALSRALDIPYMVSRISFRDSTNFVDSNIRFPDLQSDKRYLFVDDLIDSGDTIKLLQKETNIDYCVIYRNEKVEVTNRVFSYQTLKQDIWIDFFWETY